MPPLTLLFHGSEPPVIAAMQIDAAESEQHDLSAVPTRNEVESGADFTDHVRLEPEKITIVGIISDAPLSFFSTLQGTAISAAGQVVTSVTGSSLIGAAAAVGIAKGIGSIAALVQKPPRTPQEGYRYLYEIWRNRAPFKVVTKLRVYENMVLTKLGVPVTVKTGGAIQFTATFEQIRIISSQVNTVTKLNSAPKTNPNKKTNRGALSGKAAAEKTVEKSKTLTKTLKDIGVGWWRGIFGG